MLFRAGAAIVTVVFLHGAGNLERDAGAIIANAGTALPDGVSAYCQSAPATCLDLAKQAGAKMMLRDDPALTTAAKGANVSSIMNAAPVALALPLAGDSILPPRRKARG